MSCFRNPKVAGENLKWPKWQSSHWNGPLCKATNQENLPRAIWFVSELWSSEQLRPLEKQLRALLMSYDPKSACLYGFFSFAPWLFRMGLQTYVIPVEPAKPVGGSLKHIRILLSVSLFLSFSFPLSFFSVLSFFLSFFLS